MTSFCMGGWVGALGGVLLPLVPTPPPAQSRVPEGTSFQGHTQGLEARVSSRA